MRLVAYIQPCAAHEQAYGYFRGWNEGSQVRVVIGLMGACKDCKLAWDEVKGDVDGW